MLDFISGSGLTETQLDTFVIGDMEKILIFALTVLSIVFYYLYSEYNKRTLAKKIGIIVPSFSPPKDISPADAGYIYNKGFHKNQLAATLLSMEQKGAINIKKDGFHYKIHQTKSDSSVLSSEEKVLYDLMYRSLAIPVFGKLDSSVKILFRNPHFISLDGRYLGEDENGKWVILSESNSDLINILNISLKKHLYEKHKKLVNHKDFLGIAISSIFVILSTSLLFRYSSTSPAMFANASLILTFIFIVQPGLSKAQVTESILNLLGATSLYLRTTFNVDLEVIASE